MNERLVVLNVDQGEVGVTLGANFAYMTVPFALTIVAVVCSPNVDDSGLTIDINDDGSAAIEGIDCSDLDAPGEWNSKHVGGTNDPVRVAAGSELSFDANNAAANTVVHIQIWALVGEVSG